MVKNRGKKGLQKRTGTTKRTSSLGKTTLLFGYLRTYYGGLPTNSLNLNRKIIRDSTIIIEIMSYRHRHHRDLSTLLLLFSLLLSWIGDTAEETTPG